MREGLFELYVTNSNGDRLPEVQVNGELFLIASPGDEYSVRVAMHRDPVTKKYPMNYVRIGLFVDDVDVNYWKRLDVTDSAKLAQLPDPTGPVTATFWGFKKSNSDIRTFVFAMPKMDGDGAPDAHNALGTIRVEIFEAVVTQGVFDNQSGCYEVPAENHVSGSQKFWKQASVATVGGRKLEASVERFAPLTRWANASKKPIDMVLKYHSPGTIQALQIIHGELKPVTDQETDASGSDDSYGEYPARASKRARKSTEVVDLSLDDDEHAAASSSSSASSSLSSSSATTVRREDVRYVEENGRQYMSITREITCLDISEEGAEPTETTIVENRTLEVSHL